MAHFALNLMKEYVPAPRRRRTVFWILLGYVGACGVLLAGLGFTAAKRYEAVRLACAHLEVAERQLLGDYPGEGDFTLRLAWAEAGLRQCAARLSAAQDVLGRRSDVAGVVEALVRPLPAGAVLTELKYRAGADLVFDLTVLAAGTGETAAVDALLPEWNREPRIRRHFAGVAPSMSGSREQDGRTEAFHRFVCTGRKGKG